MKKAILATKVGMTQIFNEDGVLTPVTVLQAGPCVVTQVKTADKDGYSAVQVGFADKREKLVNKPLKGMFDKAGVSYKRYIREFRFENAEEYSVKDEIKADVFTAGDKVDATAISKGRDSRAQSRDMVSQEDLWLMVLNTTDMLVRTVLVQIQVRYSKERECQDIWDQNRLQFRILKL